MANLGCVEVEYFDFGYGRGDLIRQMCAAGKVQFKDTFISQADWPAVKGDTAKYPTGGLPVATINGCKMGETCAIVRFLAISTGWYPTDPMCAWAADTNLDMWTDCINSMGAVLFAPEEKKEECMAKFLCCVETFCKVASERMEHCKWKHTAGDKPSVGDVAILTGTDCNAIANAYFSCTCAPIPIQRVCLHSHLSRSFFSSNIYLFPSSFFYSDY